MLLPYASDTPPKNTPLAVVILVLVHFAVFGVFALVSVLRGPDANMLWYVNLSLSPSALHWYSLFTYSLLHGDVFHVSVNMLFLWVFGASVEDALGWKRFLCIYAVAAVLTGMVQVGMTHILPKTGDYSVIVGASGAVSAVVGLFAVRFYRASVRLVGVPFRIPAVALLAVVMLSEMAIVLWRLVGPHAALGQTVAHWSHIAGFLFGTLVGHGMRMVRSGQEAYRDEDAMRALDRGSALSAVRRWDEIAHDRPDDAVAEGRLARSWALAGDREQSVPAYLHAIEELLRKGNNRTAAVLFAEMRSSYPEETAPAETMFTIARTLEEQSEYNAAMDTYQGLLAAYPDAADAEMSLLRIAVLRLKRLGDPAQARADLNRFLASFPDSEWRDYAEQLLREAGPEGGDAPAE